MQKPEGEGQDLPGHGLAREGQADNHEAVADHHHVVDLNHLLPEVRRRLQVVMVAPVVEGLNMCKKTFYIRDAGTSYKFKPKS